VERSALQLQSKAQQEILETLKGGVTGYPISGCSNAALNAPDLLHSLSSEVNRVSKTIFMNPFQSDFEKQLTAAIQSSVAGALQTTRADEIKDNADLLVAAKLNSSRRRWTIRTSRSTTCTWFGDIDCLITITQTTAPKAGNSDCDTVVNERLRRIYFRISPASWIMRCGFKNMWRVDLSKLCTSGWQQAIEVYNVSAVYSTHRISHVYTSTQSWLSNMVLHFSTFRTTRCFSAFAKMAILMESDCCFQQI